MTDAASGPASTALGSSANLPPPSPQPRHRRPGWIRRNLCQQLGYGHEGRAVVAHAVGFLISSSTGLSSAPPEPRRAAPSSGGGGACWASPREIPLLFLARSPREQQFLLFFACLAMIAMLLISSDRRTWNWRLPVLCWWARFSTFRLMFGQRHFPLSCSWIIALVAAARLAIRGRIA